MILHAEINRKKNDIFSFKPQDIVPGLFILFIFFVYLYPLGKKLKMLIITNKQSYVNDKIIKERFVTNPRGIEQSRCTVVCVCLVINFPAGKSPFKINDFPSHHKA